MTSCGAEVSQPVIGTTEETSASVSEETEITQKTEKAETKRKEKKSESSETESSKAEVADWTAEDFINDFLSAVKNFFMNR